MSDPQNDKLLVLGGSKWQLDLIRRARALGFHTLVADISPDAPGRAIADEFVTMDTNDVDALTALAQANGVKLVIAEQTDRTVPVAAAISERLGLPGIGSDVARRFTNKLVMRDALRDSGVAMPRYAEVSSAADARERAAEWGYPVVVKPKASQSSFGVFKAISPDEVDRFIAQTLRYSSDGRFIVEEFIEGTEVTVEAFSLAGRCSVLAISEKEHYVHNDCVARRLAYPPRFDGELMQRIRETASRVVDSLGLVNGISHAEYRVRDRVPYLVEVAARGGGTRIAPTIVPHVSGVDVYDLLIRKLSGEDVTMPPLASRAAVLEFVDVAPGRVREIRGVEEALADPRVRALEMFFAPGDEVVPPTDDKTRLGYFIVLGDSRDEVDQLSERVRSSVQIIYAV